MFLGTDKDFRKGVPTKTSSTSRPIRANHGQPALDSRLHSNSTPNAALKVDMVEQAKADREHRQVLRVQTSKAIVIQSFFRGRIAAKKHLIGIRTTFDTKMSDIRKVATLLQSKGIAFVPTINIVLELWHLLKYRIKCFGDDLDRLILYFCTVMGPSLSEMDVSKNCVIALTSNSSASDPKISALFRLYKILFRAINNLLASPSRLSATHVDKTIDLCIFLQRLSGLNRPLRMRYSERIELAFRDIRCRLVEWELFHEIREILSQLADPIIGDTDNDASIRGHSTYRRFVKETTDRRVISDGNDEWSIRTIGDALTSVAVMIVESDDQEKSKRGINFTREFFSVEVWTVQLSEPVLNSIARWAFLPEALTHLSSQKVLPLPPSRQPVFKSGQWLLGNLCALSQNFVLDEALISELSSQSQQIPSGQTGRQMTDELLECFLSLCAKLSLKFSVAGVAQGTSGVVMMREGTRMTAAGVPNALRDQVHLIMHPSFARRCYDRIILPVRDDISTFASSEDVDDVDASLKQNSIHMVGSELVETQAESMWFSSKWAQKMFSSFSGNRSGKKQTGLSHPGISSSNVAISEVSSGLGDLPQTNHEKNIGLVCSLCRLWAVYLPPAAVLAGPDSIPWRNLTAMAFSTRLVDRLWTALLTLQFQDYSLHSNPGTAVVATVSAATSSFSSIFSIPSSIFSFGGSSAEAVSSKSKSASALTSKKKLISSNLGLLKRFVSDFEITNELYSMDVFNVLSVLCSVLRVVCVALDDNELYSMGRPIPLHQVIPLISVLKTLLFRMLQSNPTILRPDAQSSSSAAEPENIFSLKSIALVLDDLHTRWARRPFCSSSVWEIAATNSYSLRSELRDGTPFAVAVLGVIPWSVSFLERMTWFRSIVDKDKLEIQGSNDAAHLMMGGFRSKGVVVKIRRACIMEDGMKAFDKIGSNIKDRVVVRYVNEFGEEEAGIDAGGLFKDLLTDLSKRIFDPSYGLFSMTEAQTIYPNPSAMALFGEHEVEALYHFVGRILGKAMYENITLQPQFSHFFLALMHGNYNYMNLINDLSTLDPDLYKNLMFLKTYDGDISDLSLSFAITDDSFGSSKEIELFPGGSAVTVTSQNRHRYINAVAKYYLHDRLHIQARALFSGLHEVIAPNLLRAFCAPELQVLLSGAKTGISIEDLKANCRYAGYTSMDRNISRFWKILEDMTEADRALLLKFVTSCERPPSLGFAALQPAFTIQRVDCSDDARLPTASTCFNILKLPTYSSEAVMKNKLLTSIRSGAGFDLS